MSLTAVLAGAIAYITLLFATAWWVDRRGGKMVANPYIYSLSLAVYCTAWTYFGSVGRASSGGFSFFAVYLGPTLTAPLWFWVLRKMILISKYQRITSIADFISARFGKSSALATAVTIIAVLGIVPYISIQLKAVTIGIDVLTDHQYPYFKADIPFFLDAAFWVTCAMILFTVLFGTRKLDPNERHEGLVAAIALESMVKLIAFWIIGLFVLYVMNDGPMDLFQRAFEREDIRRVFSLSASGVNVSTWNAMMLLSAIAILLLPRQFHISVVENTNPRFVTTAMWMLPLYLLLINVFVVPIAIAGKMSLPADVSPDTYVLNLPMSAHSGFMSMLAFLGGFSAATSMVIVSSTALSIMISNHLVIPLMIRMGRIGRPSFPEGNRSLLNIRRWSIVGVLLLAYYYLKGVSGAYDLVSVGLISFTAIAQFAPAAFGGMYWRGATLQGAFAGLVVGFLIWAYCLPATSIAEAGFISSDFIEKGLFGLSWLKPRALFGLEGLDAITNAAWWSLLLNILTFMAVSSFTKPSALAVAQADLFVNIYRYTTGKEYDVIRREAKMSELLPLMNRFLGKSRVTQLLKQYETENGISLKNLKIAEADLINYLERHLSGAIGAASARLMTESVSKNENITMEEVMQVMEQTQEVMRYSKALEAKSAELEATTQQLREANEQLQALDRLKADFITTVTHELRTPVTSIKSLSKIMLDYRHELDDDKINSYLSILVSESDRISRLINQVLDIEKINVETTVQKPMEALKPDEIIRQVITGMETMFSEKEVKCQFVSEAPHVIIDGHKDRIIQAVMNLISNAYKFCSPENGRIEITLTDLPDAAILSVKDNGIGIAEQDQALIFEQFTQLDNPLKGKPSGTGLGLFITKQIIAAHHGKIWVESNPGEGATFFVQLPKHKEIV